MSEIIPGQKVYWKQQPRPEGSVPTFQRVISVNDEAGEAIIEFDNKTTQTVPIADLLVVDTSYLWKPTGFNTAFIWPNNGDPLL